MQISIAMGSYNGAVYLPEQLGSIAAQTRLPDELIVCDDCSTDSTAAIVEEFARRAPMSVKLQINERNLGSTRNFERAIASCTGDVIALCDQDDVWRSDKLQLIEDAFARAPHAGLVFSDAEIVDENLISVGRRMWAEVGLTEVKRKLFDVGRSLDVLIPGWAVTGATMAFRSRYKDFILPIPDEIPMIHDGWIALAIAAVAEANLIAEPLVKYRQHGGQQVGAPLTKRQRPRSLQSIDAGWRRTTSYADLRLTLETLRQRLTGHGDSFDCRAALLNIENYARHIDARSNLRNGRLGRLPTIFREVIGMRYHRYSKGFSSALKDLVS
jgi:glycosyltransferase involved in cell wall biosynthesis